MRGTARAMVVDAHRHLCGDVIVFGDQLRAGLWIASQWRKAREDV